MRASGILMPVFSLPGPYSIGTLGNEAFAFVDFLAATATALTRASPPLPEIPILSITVCWLRTIC